MKINVVGGGIIGVATALRLKEALPETEITVISEKFSPNTTGDVAAGIWEPFVLKDTPIELQRRWSKATWDWLLKLLKKEDSHTFGISMASGYNLYDFKAEVPSWHDLVPGFRVITEEELSRLPSKFESGFFLTSLMCEPKYYLPWLMKRFQDLGGNLLRRKVHTMEELVGDCDIAVICTGMGARELCNDHEVIPVRGQVMRVKAPWVRHFYLVELRKQDGVSYIIPNNTNVVLGGTVQAGNFNLQPTEKDRQHILRETRLIEPTLKYAEIECEAVGLRPSRKSIRLEKEIMKFPSGKTLPVVHNYGHGGAGITTHWGCAEDAVHLVRDLMAGISGTSKQSKL